MIFFTSNLYSIMLEAYAEAALERAIRKFRMEQLRQLIDRALDEWDEEAFYQYSAELARMRKGR